MSSDPELIDRLFLSCLCPYHLLPNRQASATTPEGLYFRLFVLVVLLVEGWFLVEEANARWKPSSIRSFSSVSDQIVDVVGIAQRLLLHPPETLEDPFVCMLNPRHVVHNITADGSAQLLKKRLVIERLLLPDVESVADLLQQVDQLLGIDIDEVEMFVEGKRRGGTPVPA